MIDQIYHNGGIYDSGETIDWQFVSNTIEPIPICGIKYEQMTVCGIKVVVIVNQRWFSRCTAG